jgi:hypothetical protein
MAMAFIWAVVTLGISTPLVVLLTSNCADAAGVAVPMPTLFWACSHWGMQLAANTHTIARFLSLMLMRRISFIFYVVKIGGRIAPVGYQWRGFWPLVGVFLKK